MKKSLLFSLCIGTAFLFAGCGTKTAVSESETETAAETATDTEVSETESETAADTSEEDDEAALEAVGEIEVDKGIVYVKVTVPADYAGEVTQDELDAAAGDSYTSAVLNDDGSVTYKMTRVQHDTMLSQLSTSFDEGIQELIDDDDNYTIASIEHNDDYTDFDVTLDGTELGLGDVYSAFALYIYGGLWGVFSGDDVDNVAVNFYDPDGNLIETGNSSDME